MTAEKYEKKFWTRTAIEIIAPWPDTAVSLQNVKRIARYSQGRPRCLLSFCWATEKRNTMTVVVDGVWAGCARKTCSTSGGALKSVANFSRSRRKRNHERMRGRHLPHEGAGTHRRTTQLGDSLTARAILKTKTSLTGRHLHHCVYGLYCVERCGCVGYPVARSALYSPCGLLEFWCCSFCLCEHDQGQGAPVQNDQTLGAVEGREPSVSGMRNPVSAVSAFPCLVIREPSAPPTRNQHPQIVPPAASSAATESECTGTRWHWPLQRGATIPTACVSDRASSTDMGSTEDQGIENTVRHCPPFNVPHATGTTGM